MTILRMYYTPEGAKRPTHYREAWWEEESNEFILHHGKVGDSGTTSVEQVSSSTEADLLLASFAEQNATDDYVEVDDIAQESFTAVVRYKGATPTQAEQTNADKFAREYTALLAWRGLGAIEHWEESTDRSAFVFNLSTVHRTKATQYAAEALKKTDFRADRMKIERV